MNRTGTQIGPSMAQLLAYVQQQNKMIVRTGEAAEVLGISAKQERELMSRLARSGIGIRLMRGVYMLPLRMPPGGRWNPGEYAILDALMKATGAQYQVSGPMVFNHYGFVGQIPNSTCVYNTKFYGDRMAGPASFIFVKTSKERIGGTTQFTTPTGTVVPISCKARALVDAVYDWSRFNTLPVAFGWIADTVDTQRQFAKDIVDAAVRYGNQGTCRRIGHVLARQGVAGKLLEPLRHVLAPSRSLVPLVPTCPARGQIDREWGVIANG